MTRDEATYYYLTDAHGDVIALTDASGQIVNEYSYDPWGNPIQTQEGVENPYRYAGYRFDEETGLYYCWNRYDDAGTARFITADLYPGELASPVTMNAYAYCVGNPVRWVDPSGLLVDVDADGEATALDFAAREYARALHEGRAGCGWTWRPMHLNIGGGSGLLSFGIQVDVYLYEHVDGWRHHFGAPVGAHPYGSIGPGAGGWWMVGRGHGRPGLSLGATAGGPCLVKGVPMLYGESHSARVGTPDKDGYLMIDWDEAEEAGLVFGISGGLTATIF